MNFAPRRDDCEVVVIGAGPYGLAVAAHLKAAGIATRTFGQSMSAWRVHMPKGMKLQSPPGASHLVDRQDKYSLNAFAHQLGDAPAQDQLPLEHFVRYGEWFQRQTVPDLDGRKVTRIEDVGKRFCLVLAPTNLDVQVTAALPARLLQSIDERRQARLSFPVVRGQVHEHMRRIRSGCPRATPTGHAAATPRRSGFVNLSPPCCVT